jgi:hypothetical protein
MSNPFPIPLAIMLSNGSRLATPPASSGTFQLNNNGSNEPIWAAAGSVSTLQILSSDPIPAVDGTVWVSAIGTSPSQVIALKARIDGATVVIASVTH